MNRTSIRVWLQKNSHFGVLAGIWCYGALLRVWGLRSAHPFWVDEFSSGTSARIILERGLSVYLNPPIDFEMNNSLTYSLIALFFRVFGQSESVARMPSVIFGSLIPIVAFLIARRLGGTVAGLIAAALTATSYFQIVWSVQARGYVLLQLITLLTIYMSMKLLTERKFTRKNMALWVALLCVGISVHYMYFICIAVVIGCVLFVNMKKIMERKKYIYASITLVAAVGASLWMTGFFHSVYAFVRSPFFLSNNLWYYHPFLWREYGLLVCMALVGYGLIVARHKRQVTVITLYVIAQFIFVTFLFAHHMSKYLLPLFPYLLIGSGVFISEIGNVIASRIGDIKITSKIQMRQSVLGICIAAGLALFIVGSGHKFVSKPKQYYSINHDFREIANIDYHAIYALMKDGIAKNGGENVAVIETWPGRAYWYLGLEYKPLYVFRWQNEEGLANGHPKKTPFKVRADGEKYFTDAVGFVAEVSDMQRLMKKYPKGFIFIDDDTLPREVIDFAENNLKKEIFLDHYPLDDNPYSLWPATLYSWGLGK